MMSKLMSKNKVSRRKGVVLMRAGSVIRFASAMLLILIVLTACSGSIESNFSFSNDGFDIQEDEPKFTVEETVTMELPLLNQVRLLVEAVRGDIEIEGRDDTDSITVIARKWVGSTSLEDAKQRLNELDIQVADQTDEVTIQTLQPDNRRGREYSVDYQIIFPSNLETEVTVIRGDIDVLNVQKRLLVNAVKGTVFLSTIAASVEVNLTNGNIDGTIVIPIDGEVRMYVDNGNIDLNIPTTTSAELAAAVTNGSIVTHNLEFVAAEQTIRSLIGILGNGEGAINLNTINGSISVAGLD